MGQYTKNVQFNGDPNPNGDNYVWEDVNGAITAGWVTLNDNQNTGQAVFTINPWTNNPAGTRTATFEVRHWQYDPQNPIGSLVDSFLITQYADSSATVTTTQATAATTQATAATTQATAATTQATAATTQATAATTQATQATLATTLATMGTSATTTTEGPGSVQVRQYGSSTGTQICSGITTGSTVVTFTVPAPVNEAAAWTAIANNASVGSNGDQFKIIGLADGNQNQLTFDDGWRYLDDDGNLGSFQSCSTPTTQATQATTILPSSVNISGESWIYTMGGPEDYTATVSNLTNVTYNWSKTGLNANKFLLSNGTSQVCTLEYIWTADCSGGGDNITLSVSATGTNSQGQTVVVGDTKNVNGCDDTGEGGSSA